MATVRMLSNGEYEIIDDGKPGVTLDGQRPMNAGPAYSGPDFPGAPSAIQVKSAMAPDEFYYAENQDQFDAWKQGRPWTAAQRDAGSTDPQAQSGMGGGAPPAHVPRFGPGPGPTTANGVTPWAPGRQMDFSAYLKGPTGTFNRPNLGQEDLSADLAPTQAPNVNRQDVNAALDFMHQAPPPQASAASGPPPEDRIRSTGIRYDAATGQFVYTGQPRSTVNRQDVNTALDFMPQTPRREPLPDWNPRLGGQAMPAAQGPGTGYGRPYEGPVDTRYTKPVVQGPPRQPYAFQPQVNDPRLGGMGIEDPTDRINRELYGGPRIGPSLGR